MKETPKLYPLTHSQATMYLNLKWSFGKEQVVNICSMMHFETEIDTDLLMQAIYMAILRNESAALRLHKVGKNVMQYFSTHAPQPIIVMDYSGSTQDRLDSDIARFSATPFPNHSMDVQLYSIRLIKKPDGFYGLYFCVSHLIFDAFSLMMTADDILSIYVCLRDSKPIPPSLCDSVSCLEEDMKYSGSEKEKADRAFWNDVVYATEPIFTSVNGIDHGDHIKGKRIGHTIKIGRTQGAQESYRLPAELVSRVNELADKLKVSSQALYTLAVRSYLSKMNDNCDDVTLLMTMARRATLLEKRAYGVRVNGIFFRFAFSNSLSFADAAYEVFLTQLKIFSHVDLGTTEIIDIYQKKFNIPGPTGYHSFMLTYQPVSLVGQETVPVHFSVHTNGIASSPLYLTIMALDKSGDLNCNYEYYLSYLKPGVPKLVHEHLIKVLDAATKNPDITLDELAKL